MFLSDAEADAIDEQIGRLESQTGVQPVTAVIDKSDTYVELPWKAFALGAALAGFAVVLADTAWPQWVTSHTALIYAITILRAAAASALLASKSFQPGAGLNELPDRPIEERGV